MKRSPEERHTLINIFILFSVYSFSEKSDMFEISNILENKFLTLAESPLFTKVFGKE